MLFVFKMPGLNVLKKINKILHSILVPNSAKPCAVIYNDTKSSFRFYNIISSNFYEVLCHLKSLLKHIFFMFLISLLYSLLPQST